MPNEDCGRPNEPCRLNVECGFDSNFTLPKRRFWKAEQKMTSGFSIDVSTPNKRRFGKDEQKMKCGFSSNFQGREVLNLGHEPLKSASFEIRISSFVPPFQIFVWGA
jgi:hypothetical protein